MTPHNILPRIVAALKRLEHAYLGVQRRDGSKHLVVLFDHGEPTHGEADGAPDAPHTILVAMMALVEDCIGDDTHVLITAVDEGDCTGPEAAKATYSCAYLDCHLVPMDPEELTAFTQQGDWDDLYKLLG